MAAFCGGAGEARVPRDERQGGRDECAPSVDERTAAVSTEGSTEVSTEGAAEGRPRDGRADRRSLRPGA